MTVAEPEIDEATERFNRQWPAVVSGLDRAVAWIKDHESFFRGRNRGWCSVGANSETGVAISLGWYLNEKDAVAVAQLFKGQQATRREKRDSEITYRVVNQELRLTFEWSVWIHREPQSEPEAVTVVL